jgi:copper chaperone CopZ
MEDAVVETLNLDLPTMYGDHHVVEVRRLLLEMPGVKDVYASSCFHTVEVEYDEAALTPELIMEKLDQAGYLGELPVPVEQGATGERQNGEKPFFRHTAAYEQAGRDVSFAQVIPYAGRPLWPCPGMGPIENREEEVSHG